MIYIPELDFGNLRTLGAFLETLNLRFSYVQNNNLTKIEKGIILIPGNGNWSSYIKSGFVNLIRNKKELIFIGICGGFQIFFESSEESPGKGAGLVPGHVKKLSSIIPRIGYLDIGNHGHMYFSNSYGVQIEEFNFETVESYRYDDKDYIGCFKYKNLIGFQFHPEVSGNAGKEIFLKYIKNLDQVEFMVS